MNSLAQILGIGGYHCFRSERVKNLEVFLIDHLYNQEAIRDDQFLKRRKIIETLRTNPEVYFLYLDPESAAKSIISDRTEVLEFKRVDMTVNKDIIWKGSFS